nr:DUF202 domain-containing protein [Caenimonas sedimenti]
MELRPTDAGLQAQRTSLVWSRTALAFAVNAILVLRFGFLEGDAAMIIAGTGIALAAILAAGVSIRRHHQLAESFDLAMASISWVCLGTLVAACAGLALVMR